MRPFLTIVIASAFSCGQPMANLVSNEGGEASQTVSAGTGLAVKVVARGSKACVLTQQNELFCWGDNSSGAFGVGVPSMRQLSPQAPLLGVRAPIVEAALGDGHLCVIGTERSIAHCLGENQDGQVDPQFHQSTRLPRPVFPEVEAVAVASGKDFSCGIFGAGQVRCWGANNAGQLGNRSITNARSIVAGNQHACVITHDDEVKCWGSHARAQLGSPSASSGSAPQTVLFPRAGRAKVLAAGPDRTCAIVKDSNAREHVYCWGDNKMGTLVWTRSDEMLDSPTRVPAIPTSGLSLITVGTQHQCVTWADKHAYCWGDNSFGQLGAPVSESLRGNWVTAALTDETVISIAAGDDFTCLVNDAGQLRCYGKNENGELGQGHSGGFNSVPMPVNGPPVVTFAKVESVALGENSGCATLENGEMRCFGDNHDGLLGVFDVGQGLVPTVAAFNGSVQMATRATGRHQCFVSEDSVACMGRNDFGQMGFGQFNSTINAAGRLSGNFGKALQVATGDDFSCAIFEPGDVYCWGDNSSKQLGHRDVIATTWPHEVEGLQQPGMVSKAISIAATRRSACAVVARSFQPLPGQPIAPPHEFKLYCWGSNENGILGSHWPFENSAKPLEVPVPVGVEPMSLSGYRDRYCFADWSGKILCWGNNALGSLLGDVSSEPQLSQPTLVAGYTNSAAQVSVGKDTVCALDYVGDAHCWGNNSAGQVSLRVPASEDTLSPTRMGVYNEGVLIRSEFKSVSTGNKNTCLTTIQGELYCQGSERAGAMGTGFRDGSTVNSASRVSFKQWR